MAEANSLEGALKRLFLLAMKGDEVAYQTFLTSSETLVQRYLTRLGGRQVSTETLADICQEIMLSIHLKKHTYLPERPLLPWLYAITRYRYIDHFRSQKRRLQTVELIEEQLPQHEEAMSLTLEEMLAPLTPQQRQLIQLVKVEEMPYAEVAQQMDIREPALRTNVHRILKTLRQKLSR